MYQEKYITNGLLDDLLPVSADGKRAFNVELKFDVDTTIKLGLALALGIGGGLIIGNLLTGKK